MIDLWSTVGSVLADHRYLVLGTADGAGNPWVTPVFFAARDEHTVYWVSSPDSRHSRNIGAHPGVAITVFDSRGPIGVGDAVYLTGTARALDGADASSGLGILNARLPADRQLTDEDLTPRGALVVYEATVDEHDVLVRGGDPRFDNEVDARQRVTAP